MKRRKRKLTYLLLVPLALVVLLQGLLPFSILLVSRAKETMERGAVDNDSNLVENRRVVLENAMTDQWSEVRYESTFLNTELKAFLTEHQADIRGFLGDKEMQRARSLLHPGYLQYCGTVFWLLQGYYYHMHQYKTWQYRLW